MNQLIREIFHLFDDPDLKRENERMKTFFDRKTIESRCEEFFALYGVTRGRIHDMCQAKVTHTRAVAANCLEIAENLGLNEYDCDLAWIIGELHDFSRFGQAVVTKTYRDSDLFNHAKLGARILFVHRMVEDIIPNFDRLSAEDQRVLEKAVYHHSDYRLPDNLTERERMFCKIIREADQLDIFRTIVESGWETIYGCSREEILASEISDGIAEAFFRHQLADYAKRVKPADFHLAHIALCFGLESKAARKRALEQGYLQQMMELTFSRPEVQEKYIRLKAEAENFLTEE